MSTPQPRRLERDRNDEGRPENARPRDRFGAPLPRGAADELAHREEPEDVVSSAEEALDHAVRLFDQQRFFEAHEFLEYVWKSDEVPDGDRSFWKGVTQVAVGCTHVQRGNAKGAITLLQRAARHVAPYPTPYHGIDTAALAQQANQLADDVRRHGAAPQRRFFAFPVASASRTSGPSGGSS